MAPVRTRGIRLNSNVNWTQPSEIFKNESGAGDGAYVWLCVFLRDTDVWAATSLLTHEESKKSYDGTEGLLHM